MSRLKSAIPELAALESRQQLIRIPPELDIPVTERVKALIDTAAFRRLARISQLGLVGLVYPAAHHSRFEHSLGVYHTALLFLQRLQHDPRFEQRVVAHAAEVFLAAALLHDIGHWPFCHPIEDMGLPDVPSHEAIAARVLQQSEIPEILQNSWNISWQEVAGLLAGQTTGDQDRILQTMLSGPMDVDKLDYLPRDSLHAGVPYGRNFDRDRLIGSLCLNQAGNGLALTEKGRTAAEMMVFARYVMFSEVYWHHAVRSATAMFQTAFSMLVDRVNLDLLFGMPEFEFVAQLQAAASDTPAARLLDGIFGPSRQLYKRLVQYSSFQQPEIYRLFAQRPFAELRECSARLAALLSESSGTRVEAHEVIIDSPPPGREIEFHVDMFFPKENCYRPLRDVSPIARTLAFDFDDYVKRLRVFVPRKHLQRLEQLDHLDRLLVEAAGRT